MTESQNPTFEITPVAPLNIENPQFENGVRNLTKSYEMWTQLLNFIVRSLLCVLHSHVATPFAQKG